MKAAEVDGLNNMKRLVIEMVREMRGLDVEYGDMRTPYYASEVAFYPGT